MSTKLRNLNIIDKKNQTHWPMYQTHWRMCQVYWFSETVNSLYIRHLQLRLLLIWLYIHCTQ